MAFDMDEGWGGVGGGEIVNPCELSLFEDFPHFSSKAMLTMTADPTRDIMFLYWCGSFCAASNVCFNGRWYKTVKTCRYCQRLDLVILSCIIILTVGRPLCLGVSGEL